MLNALACFLVVMIHGNGVFWIFSYDEYWKSANIIESVCYCCVPLFFMITGATLFDYSKRYSTKEFFIKRIQKTLIPYIGWSVIDLFIKWIRNSELPGSPFEAVQWFLANKYNSLYWFFPCLFCIYLMAPLFTSISEDKKKEVYRYLLVFGFIFNYLLVFVRNLFSIDIVLPLHMIAAGDYMLYAIAGYYFAHYEVSKEKRTVVYILGVIGLLSMIIGTQLMLYRTGNISTLFKEYINVPCFLYSIAVFVLIKYHHSCFEYKKLRVVVNTMTKYTFGIYLCHLYVLKFWELVAFRCFHIDKFMLLYRMTSPFVVIPVVIVGVCIMRKIPVILKIVPRSA